MKTPYDSYLVNSLPKGCQLCVAGKKSVLFVSGVCSRNCWYCSLSKKRKNKDIIFVNERQINKSDNKILIQEIKESNSQGIGITGGDPLLFLNRTIEFAKIIKKHFKKQNKNFHIHIYLPTKLVDKNKLNKLSKYIDEVRFHPEFLSKFQTEEEKVKDIIKIRLALLFWKKENIGVELPMIPNKKHEILDFITKISPFVGFINLNEFEISDTNFDKITDNYKLSKDTYTISGSRKAGIWLINQINKLRQTKPELNLNIHFCTANTKNQYQFKNRLKLHKVLPFAHKTSEGTVIYLAVYLKKGQKVPAQIKQTKEYYFDKQKNRIILSLLAAKKLLAKRKYKIERVEEFPTFDRIEVERETLE